MLRIGSCQSGLAHDVMFACGVILLAAPVRVFGCVFVFWLCISGRMCTFSGKGTAVCTDKSTHGRDSGSSGQATSSPHSSRWGFDRGDLGGLSPVWYTGLRWDHIRSHVFVKVVGRPT